MASSNKSKSYNNKNQGPNKKSIYIAVAVVVVFAIFAIALFIAFPPGGGINTTSSDQANSANEADSNNGSDEKGETTMTGKVTAVIDIADYGKITVELDADAAPITVENFVNLANSGFYNGLTFHRIMEGFMMQGGDPLGNGTGGSDENIEGEFAANGIDNPLSHTRGAISMARSNDPDSASSQFFICHQDAEFLDGNYACFGYVTDGIDVVDAVCESAVPIDNNGTIPSENQPVINSITIQ